MNTQIKYILNIAGTWILVIVLLGIVFFWADRLCDNTILDSVMPSDYGINISPSGIMPNEKEMIKEHGDKYSPSSVEASMIYTIFFTLGMFEDIIEEETKFQNLSMMSVAYDIATDNVSSTIKPETLDNSRQQRTYFDKDKGLFVNCYLSRNFEGRDKWSKKNYYYIGPEGVSNEANEELGRFIQPLTNEIGNFYEKTTVFYDKGLRRFFRVKITGDEKTVTKGPELDAEKYNPVQIGSNNINSHECNMLFNWFTFPNDSKSANQAADENSRFTSDKYLIVVNNNGRIDLLDTETLELKPAGHLPEYAKLQHSYAIKSVFFENNYLGLMVSTISSNLRYMDTYVFDAAGKKINGKGSWLNEEKLPGGFASIFGRYIIESLQPAGLNILSYLTAHNYDGFKSQQAMFVRPNSYIASFARKAAGNNDAPFLIEQLGALVVMGPSLIIGILLGWRVSKRAKALGLSKTAIRVWTYGVIFTGVAGYLTFLFTKHGEAMVTCKNCGQLRRVEQETCHNCKTNWAMKHLKAADWRIIGT